MSYKLLLSIKDKDFRNKNVLIIGAGWMAEQFALALKNLNVKNVSIMSKTQEYSSRLAEKFDFCAYSGGYRSCLQGMPVFDLVIVATRIGETCLAASAAVDCGNKNLLIEKPGSLYPGPLKELQGLATEKDAHIRIGYNRLCYPNFWKLRECIENDGGILSCRYTFTELIRSIDFEKDEKDVYTRWGISNSLHVISTAHALIGLPKKWEAYQNGSLDWHPSGSRFVGSGITEKEIPFSYHADWSSAGRWGIEIMTPQNAYRLVPMEKLFCCKRGTFQWNEVTFDTPFPNVKQGVAEEVSVMLDEKMEKRLPLMDIQWAITMNKTAEIIFGYTS